MTETLNSFVLRRNGESYLFGYEDYMNYQELKYFWMHALWTVKDLSERPYGELDVDAIVDVTARIVGLRPPAQGSMLYDFVIEEAISIIDYETERLELARLGEIDLNEDTDDMEYMELLRMRSSL